MAKWRYRIEDTGPLRGWMIERSEPDSRTWQRGVPSLIHIDTFEEAIHWVKALAGFDKAGTYSIKVISRLPKA